MGAERASGRSAESGFLAAGGNAGGAPSCDSAELAYIRNGLGEAQERTTLYQWCRTLLRMVDELTKARARSADAIRNREREALDAMAEADELRAKLAEAEKTIASLDIEIVGAMNDYALEKKEAASLRFQLADLRETHDDWSGRIRCAEKRVEAAEARVKELETELDATIAPPMGAGGE